MVDFLGIGVQKGGTTWLFHQLSRHPQVAFPAGKEVHFWDRADASHVAQWLKVLEPPSRQTPAGLPIRSGEITPAYATLPIETIRALQSACPEIRLFISFRNPLERAWSAALMALVRAQMLDAEVSDQWFIDHIESSASRRSGDYVGMLDRWESVFSEDQLFPLISDDIEACPVGVLEALADHLRIDPAGFALVPAAELAERVVPSLTADMVYKQQQDLPPRPTIVAALQQMYGPEVEKIGKRLGRDLKRWVDGFGMPRGTGPLPRREVRVGGKGHNMVNVLLDPAAAGTAPPGMLPISPAPGSGGGGGSGPDESDQTRGTHPS